MATLEDLPPVPKEYADKRGDSIKQEKEEDHFTPEELQYIRVALILALGNPDVKDIPKSEAAMKELFTKVDRIYHHTHEGEKGEVI